MHYVRQSETFRRLVYPNYGPVHWTCIFPHAFYLFICGVSSLICAMSHLVLRDNLFIERRVPGPRDSRVPI